MIILRLRKCIGCGAILQQTDENKPGYINDVDDMKQTYCKRCFRLKHYNELPKIVANKESYEKIIDNVLTKNGLLVLIVDIFDFTGTFIPTIINRLRPKNVILVANKIDLLPKSTNVGKVVEWLSKMCNKVFFKVDAIHVVSSKKGTYIDDLVNTIDLLRGGKDVYFIGCANVGKSSLINAILKRFTTQTQNVISTSEIPGTTLDTINIPFFEDNKSLIDTPGLINDSNILSRLLPASYRAILPNKEIKPITYQLIKDNCVFISGMAVISLIEGENVSFTCYFSQNVLVHRTKNSRIDDLLSTKLGTMLTPPTIDEASSIVYEDKEFIISDKRKQDIVISGLGFITVSKKAKIIVKVIKGTDVYARDAIIGS